ncbi:hypothetical protein GCM10008090_20380 [Arenicella chitinivorans]|uniref:Lipoprotein n=1 Tax=Arenicella chitinivorans TaxID=1329800 RepID=A0A918VNP8_9GAMM|nr:hypothetical protein [Arenicella chitinivorans]GHA10646.1 hypothetical protein GCM10008090_20380 [Arenicella chitinivorans]
MNTYRVCFVAGLVLVLTGCGVAEFLIKRTISNLEQKVATEIKDYADFTPAQERHIDQIAYRIASRIRGERLPLLVQHLELLASEIEQEQRISADAWRTLTLFLESPVALSDKPDLIHLIADLTYDMTQEQRDSTITNVEQMYEKRLENLQASSPDDRNDKILKMTRRAFNELGLSRSRAQWKSAREFLSARESYLPLEIEAAQRNYERFIGLLRTRGDSRQAYRRDFLDAWRLAEQPYVKRAPATWQKNFLVSHEMVSRLLQDVDVDEAQEAAYELREYAALLTELSWTSGQAELTFADADCASGCL